MDDPQTAFATQYSYSFDIDMMKVCSIVSLIDMLFIWFQRSMETVGGPDAKKARWSPTFAGQTNTSNSNNRDAFANYGYGPQASIAQSAPFNNSPTSAVFGNNPLYTTTSLSINTQTNGAGIPSQLSPNNVVAFGQQGQQQQHGQQQQSNQQQSSPNGNGYSSFPTGYTMHGMGLPGMNMLGNFSYNGQMANFAQVLPLYDQRLGCSIDIFFVVPEF